MFIDKTGLLAAYYANVRSILEYDSVVWAGTAKSHLDRLERIQHKFLMFLAGTRRDHLNVLNYNELCVRYNVQKLSKRRSALDLSFLHGLFNGRIDSTSLVERFSLRVPARQTHSNELFALTNPRVSVCNASLFFRLPRVMNSILTRALQWSGNPYGNGFGVEMDENGAQFVKILWIGLDLGQTVDLTRA